MLLYLVDGLQHNEQILLKKIQKYNILQEYDMSQKYWGMEEKVFHFDAFKSISGICHSFRGINLAHRHVGDEQRPINGN